MSLLSYAFLTQADVKSWIRNASPTADELATIDLLINAVTDRWEQEIGRQIVARAVTEYADGTGESSLTLSKAPLTAVTALKALDSYGATLYTYDHTTVTITPWGRITLSGGVPFFAGEANILATYTQGWGAASACPADLKLAALQTVGSWYANWANKRGDMQSVSIGGQTTTLFDEEIPKRARAVLDRYTVPGASA